MRFRNTGVSLTMSSVVRNPNIKHLIFLNIDCCSVRQVSVVSCLTHICIAVILLVLQCLLSGQMSLRLFGLSLYNP
jgi:hypothetical protein